MVSFTSSDRAVWIAAIVVTIGFVGGVAAAVPGGPFTDLDSGAGASRLSRPWYSI